MAMHDLWIVAGEAIAEADYTPESAAYQEAPFEVAVLMRRDDVELEATRIVSKEINWFVWNREQRGQPHAIYDMPEYKGIDFYREPSKGVDPIFLCEFFGSYRRPFSSDEVTHFAGFIEQLLPDDLLRAWLYYQEDEKIGVKKVRAMKAGIKDL